MLRFFLLLGMATASLSSYGQTAEDMTQKTASIIGIGRDGLCSSCHAVNSSQTFQRWSTASKRVETCLAKRTAEEKLTCIGQTDSLGADFTLEARQLGIFAAGLHVEPLKSVIKEALGESRGEALLEALSRTTLMPLRAPSHMTGDEFTAVRSWFAADMPNLDKLLEAGDDSKEPCMESFDPQLKDHLKKMASLGWKARNESEGLAMYACPPSGGACFTQKRDGADIFPDVSQAESMKAWKFDPKMQMRVISPILGKVQYWIRSSADGRFVAYGGSPSGVIDLQARLGPNPSTRVIPVSALYDPGFFPDDSGFVFQGSRTGICNMSLLRDPATTSVNFSEDACTTLNENRIPLYQSIGASLDGEDYLAATSHYQRDVGSITAIDEHIPSEDPAAESGNRLQLYPIEFDGQVWTRKAGQNFATPFEIDWGLSHSNKLLISRLQGEVDEVVRGVGYNVYGLSRDAGGTFQKKPFAKICTDGGKGDFSYDDRFFITYSYIRGDHWRQLGYQSANDPEFVAKLKAGTSNIVLVDLYSQERKILTNMGAGQFAFFPHFRSDGWIYFESYDSLTGGRQVLATDAAIQMAQTAPIP